MEKEKDFEKEMDDFFGEEDSWDNPKVKDQYIEALEKQVKGYKEFLEYLYDNCNGNVKEYVELVAETDHVDFIGYVDAKYEIDRNGKPSVVAEVPNFWYGKEEKVKLHFEWQSSHHYIHQRADFEDSYYGFMLFPTYKANKFYCVYYTC